MLDQAILANSHIIYTHEEILHSINHIATRLNKEFSGKKVLLFFDRGNSFCWDFNP